MTRDAGPKKCVSDALALVILLYAAAAPMAEFLRWIIEVATPDFEALLRQDKRLLFREHWLGAGFKALERAVILPTGLILGWLLLFTLATALVLYLTRRQFGLFIVGYRRIGPGSSPGQRPHMPKACDPWF